MRSMYIAGASGMAGSAVARKFPDAITDRVELTNWNATNAFFKVNKFDSVVMCAGLVGGIAMNLRAGSEFLAINAQIAVNTIRAAHRHDVKKFLYLGSTCMYPRHCVQPMAEYHLMTGDIEPTNAGYAMAKLLGMQYVNELRKIGRDYYTIVPTNMYGPGDNYCDGSSHVMAALIKRFMAAKDRGDEEVTVWGTGRPVRDFIHVDDFAEAVAIVGRHGAPEGVINVASGKGVSIADLARLIAQVVGFEGVISFDRTQPDGMYSKVADISLITRMGWKPKIGLKEGITRTVEELRA